MAKYLTTPAEIGAGAPTHQHVFETGDGFTSLAAGHRHALSDGRIMPAAVGVGGPHEHAGAWRYDPTPVRAKARRLRQLVLIAAAQARAEGRQTAAAIREALAIPSGMSIPATGAAGKKAPRRHGRDADPRRHHRTQRHQEGAAA